MVMKASLQLKLGQSLTMTPQLQQAIRLLQLSTLDLQQEIQQALESNPLLESQEDDDQVDMPAADGEQNQDQASDESSPEPVTDASGSDWDESETVLTGNLKTTFPTQFQTTFRLIRPGTIFISLPLPRRRATKTKAITISKPGTPLAKPLGTILSGN